MECQDIVEKVRIHAVTRIESVDTPQGCRIRLPILEPSGDVISVTVVKASPAGKFHVTDGGRLNGLLFESSTTKPSSADKLLVRAIAERATLEFDDEQRVYYATAEPNTLGYWAFEVGRTIATVASVVPPPRRRRRGRKLSKYVIGQLEKELTEQGLRYRLRGPKRIKGVTETEQRVDLSYRKMRTHLLDGDNFVDVFVIATDLKQKDPVLSARSAVFAAHDLSALAQEPIVRIVHGVVTDDELNIDRTGQARRLIESVASASGIEEYSWDNNDHKAKFLSTIRDELTYSHA